MNRQELVSKMAQMTGMSKANLNIALDSFIETVTKALKSGDDVRLVGFGTFATLSRKKMEGRNPRTGEKITIPASKRPKFRSGKQLVDAVN